MRTILFVICFSLGVSLMVFSGYLPKAASAREGTGELVGSDSGRRTLTPRYYPDITPRPAGTSPAAAGDANFVVLPDPSLDPNAGLPSTTGDDGLTPPPTPVSTEPNNAASSAGPRHKRDRAPKTDVPASLAGASTNSANAEATKSETEAAGPVAEAGPDRIVWIGWNELVLDGSASSGEGLSYRWKQVAGPVDLQLKRPGRVKTTATGLPMSAEMDWASTLYEFELTVTDKQGREAQDKVGMVVLSGPELKITPAAQRRFELRDGYLLGHYEAWATSIEGEGATFRIASPVGLAFTKVTGANYEVASGDASGGAGGGGRGEGRGGGGGRYVYKVTVYPDPSEIASYVELLVDTEEKVPGIVRLGVTWER